MEEDSVMNPDLWEEVIILGMNGFGLRMSKLPSRLIMRQDGETHEPLALPAEVEAKRRAAFNEKNFKEVCDKVSKGRLLTARKTRLIPTEHITGGSSLLLVSVISVNALKSCFSFIIVNLKSPGSFILP